MRYWFDGEDEGYERECERVRHFGGVWPAPTSGFGVAAIILLAVIHALAVIGAVAFTLWF
jgi:hypothetical protein